MRSLTRGLAIVAFALAASCAFAATTALPPGFDAPPLVSAEAFAPQYAMADVAPALAPLELGVVNGVWVPRAALREPDFDTYAPAFVSLTWRPPADTPFRSRST